jgi:hypothetical protein
MHFKGQRVVGHAQKILDTLFSFGWAIYFELFLSVQQRHRLHEANQPQEVVAVKVRYENCFQSHRAQPSERHLPLCALATIEQQKLSIAPQSYRGQATLSRWDAAAGSKKNKLHVITSRSKIITSFS